MGRQEMKLVTSTVINLQAERRKGTLCERLKRCFPKKGIKYINRQK